MTTINLRLLLVLAFVWQNLPLQAQQVSECEQSWVKIGEVQKALFEAESFAVTTTFQTTIDGRQGEVLEVHLWKDRDKYVIDQPYMKVWADSINNAILMKEAKTLLLRNNLEQDEFSRSLGAMSPQTMLDSAKQFTNAMACHCEKGVCAINVRYRTDHRLNTSKIAEATMIYKEKSYILSEFTLVSYASGKKVSHRVVISDYNNDPDRMDLTSTVLERIASSGKLKKEFESYAFRDLRSE